MTNVATEERTHKPQNPIVRHKKSLLWLAVGIIIGLAIMPIANVVTPRPTLPPTITATPCNSSPCVILIKNSQPFLANGNSATTVQISKGTTVVWVNTDVTQHTVTSDNGVFNSGILNPGQSFSFTFNTNGTFGYHNNVHPMSGTVVVVG